MGGRGEARNGGRVVSIERGRVGGGERERERGKGEKEKRERRSAGGE